MSFFTNEQVASYMKDNNLSGAAAQKAADVFGISATQLVESMKLLNSGNTLGIDAAHAAYIASATPQQLADNAAWEISKGLHSAPVPISINLKIVKTLKE